MKNLNKDERAYVANYTYSILGYIHAGTPYRFSNVRSSRQLRLWVHKLLNLHGANLTEQHVNINGTIVPRFAFDE